MKSSTPLSAGDRIRPETRAALLAALEHTPPLTLRRLEALTSLSPVTLRHACEALCREGILTCTEGHDPASGHICHLLSPTRAPILPLIELTDTCLLWRLFDTWGAPVATVLRERSALHTAEDDLAYLFGRVSELCAASEVWPLPHAPCAPVLLLPDAYPEKEQATARIRRIWGQAPQLVLPSAEAVGQALTAHPATKEDTCLLHLCVDTKASVLLLVRSHTDAPFLPAPHAADLSRTLAAYVGNALPLSAPHTAGIAAFLADLGRFITIDRVVLELSAPADEAARSALETACRASLRPAITVLTSPSSPSSAHLGAILRLRRAVWAASGEPADHCTRP